MTTRESSSSSSLTDGALRTQAKGLVERGPQPQLKDRAAREEYLLAVIRDLLTLVETLEAELKQSEAWRVKWATAADVMEDAKEAAEAKVAELDAGWQKAETELAVAEAKVQELQASVTFEQGQRLSHSRYITDLEARITELEAENQRLKDATGKDFNAGVLWAAAFMVNGYDQPTMAVEMCREAGLTVAELKACDEADRPAARRILAEWPLPASPTER